MSDHQPQTVSSEPPVYPSQPEAQALWVGRVLSEVCDEADLDIRNGLRDFGSIEPRRGRDLVSQLSHAYSLATRRGVRSFPHHALQLVKATNTSLPNLIAFLKQAIENAINKDDITAASRSGPVPLDGRIQTDIIEAARIAGRILAEWPTSPATAPVDGALDAFRWSSDYSSVFWHGQSYELSTPQQRCAFQELTEAWEKKTPNLHVTTIMTAIDSGCRPDAMAKAFRRLFKGTGLLDTLIKPGLGKGQYRLEP